MLQAIKELNVIDHVTSINMEKIAAKLAIVIIMAVVIPKMENVSAVLASKVKNARTNVIVDSLE